MNISVIQLVLLLIIIFTGSRAFFRLREGNLELGAFIFWLLVWMGGTVVILFPAFTTKLANQFGIGRGADAITYVSIIVLFYLIFRLHVALEDVRHEISELVRQIALSNVLQPQKPKKSAKK